MRLFLFAVTLSLCAGCKTAAPVPDEDVVEQYPDELQIEDLTRGTGEAAIAGMNVIVHYTGTLTTGQQFDSSLTREPLRFKLGARKVIKGWDQGLLGMKVGGKRRLIIPPRLAYGDKTAGLIPPRAWLIFEVELMAIEP